MQMTRCLPAVALLAILLPALPAAAGEEAKTPAKDTDQAKQSKKSIAKAEKLLKESRALHASILDHKQDAAAKQQTGRHACLIEQEAESKGLLRIAENALEAMRTAAANNDHVTVGHELAKIELAAEKIMKASGQADLCGDDIRNYDGPTILEVEEPEDSK